MSDNSTKKSNLIYGRKLILDAIDDNKQFERIYLRDNLTGEFEKELRNVCKSKEIPLKKVPQVKLDKLVRNRNHQGVVGIGSLVDYQDLSSIIAHIFEQGEEPLLVLLDNVQDVRNIGAIARSLEAFGGQGLILSGKNVGMITFDSLKASAGALTRIMVAREKNTIDTIELLENSGIITVATSLSGDKPISKIPLKGPLCLLVGSEGNGLHRSVEDRCTHKVKIIQRGKIDSLNVSVATGIALYEIQRQSNNEL